MAAQNTPCLSRISAFILLPSAFILLPLPPAAAADEPRWVPIASDQASITAPPEVLRRAFSEGIGGGYLTVNPQNGDLYVEGHAALKSTDQGQTYTLVDPQFSWCGAFPLCTDFHRGGQKLAIFGWSDRAGSSGSGYSLDGGRSWHALASFDDPQQKDRGGITGGALEPGTGQTILVRGYNYHVKNLFYSPDLGATWRPLAKTRDGVQGWGVFNPRELVVSYWNHIERSDDAGESWTEVSKFGFCYGPLVHLGPAAWWLSDKGLVTSRDQGRTWTLAGTAPPARIRDEVWTGLVAGRDENHFLFLSKAGPLETLDAGQTWRLVAEMPDEFVKTHLGISLGYDPAHDIFYLIAGGHGGVRPVKYARHELAPAAAQ